MIHSERSEKFILRGEIYIKNSTSLLSKLKCNRKDEEEMKIVFYESEDNIRKIDLNEFSKEKLSVSFQFSNVCDYFMTIQPTLYSYYVSCFFIDIFVHYTLMAKNLIWIKVLAVIRVSSLKTVSQFFCSR